MIMNSFTIQPSNNFNTGKYFLTKRIKAYYHQDYTTFGAEGNPDFINHLKNQFRSTGINVLQNSAYELGEILKVDLNKIKSIYRNINMTVCVIPRAKKESYYSENQKLFRRVVSVVVDGLNGYYNGTAYIIRHTNTRTTHMDRSGYGGDGNLPYVGITKDTCNISNEVSGKDILLIDDIYTSGVNIDEDAIQALLDKEARNVYLYAVGKTLKGREFKSATVNVDDFIISESE